MDFYCTDYAHVQKKYNRTAQLGLEYSFSKGEEKFWVVLVRVLWEGRLLGFFGLVCGVFL